MEIESKITFKYSTEKEAQVALGSLKPDNMDFLKAYVEDNDLICDLESRKLRTILATIDDLLFCEMMAEKIIDFATEE
ncbi:KEOPS complex subunit Pcc1 [Methanobacterium sp. ACI-7]|uniref:KEOPS complex subunit Pcc1 n=1 Tax=unclassified Methanobacterium TaxID=2627676 RepID=UPI0039C14F5D